MAENEAIPRLQEQGPQADNLKSGLNSATPPGNAHNATIEKDHGVPFPSLSNFLSEATITSETAPARDGSKLPEAEEDDMFHSIQKIFAESQGKEGSFDVQELLDSLDQADADARRGQRNLQALEGVNIILDRLWRGGSKYFARAADALANGSRDPSWRGPYGQAGILDFFLRVIATERVDDEILLHSLRLIGNSCADTDENRQRVVDKNATLSVVRLFLNPAVIHVAIPVIYNICTDFEPAQVQAAGNGLGYVLLKSIFDKEIEGEALLSYTYELIEIASEKAQGVERSPDSTVQLILQLATGERAEFVHFACLINCLTGYLQNERFQKISVNRRLIEDILALFPQSQSFESGGLAPEESQLLGQLKFKLIQVLSDISALSEFSQIYPLDSAVTATLRSWLESADDQLQICSCVMLGNLARSDEVCATLVHKYGVHKSLVSILNGEAKGAVLHAALGFLKNLSIAGDNRSYLGEAGIIPAVSRLWTFDSVPHVQFSAVSLTRQVIVSSLENIARLLEPLSSDPDSPAHERTYLSLLLSLFATSDSTPIKTDIGRSVASICRQLYNNREASSNADELRIRLFSLHDGVARPVGTMVTQKEWPVVQSEGWFALALMASTEQGSLAVADCLENVDVFQLLVDTVRTSLPTTEMPMIEQKKKNRDNGIILVNGLLKNKPPTLSPGRVATLQDLLKEVSASLA